MKKYLLPGMKVLLEIPYSEVCMHMGVAGTVMGVELISARGAQLIKDGRKFSAPILPSEAGLYHDEYGYYCYQ